MFRGFPFNFNFWLTCIYFFFFQLLCRCHDQQISSHVQIWHIRPLFALSAPMSEIYCTCRAAPLLPLQQLLDHNNHHQFKAGRSITFPLFLQPHIKLILSISQVKRVLPVLSIINSLLAANVFFELFNASSFINKHKMLNKEY